MAKELCGKLSKIKAEESKEYSANKRVYTEETDETKLAIGRFFGNHSSR
jgi:hypothetical protein